MLKRILLNLKPVSSKVSMDKKMEVVKRPLKHYMFMIREEDRIKHINIIAEDKTSAELKLQSKYPDCKADFLWEDIIIPRPIK
jgi:hypothetical protein